MRTRERFRAVAVACLVAMSAFAAVRPAASAPAPNYFDDPAGFDQLHFVTGEVALPKSEAELSVPPHARAFVGRDDAAFDLWYARGATHPDECACDHDEAQLRLARAGSITYRFFNHYFTPRRQP